MDSIAETSGTPEVSTGTVDSPSTTADSSVSTETPQITESAVPETSSSASAASQEEWPDDAAMSAMTGQERSSHWQNLRTRYDGLNQQLAEAQAQLAQYQQQAQAANAPFAPDLLFAPKVDPATGQPVIDPATGEPITSPAPFVERLRDEAPGVFGQMVTEIMRQPWSENENTDRVLFRDYFGLNPDLIDTYRQIQSAEDAQSHIQPPADMSHIPQQYHDLYKSLDWETRDQIDAILDDAPRNLALRGLNAEFQQQQAQKAAEARQAEIREQQAQQQRESLSAEIRNGVQATLKQQLQSQIQLTGDEATDGMLWNMLFAYGAAQLGEDPTAVPVLNRLSGYVQSLEKHQARQQQLPLAAHAARVLKEPIEKLSGIFADARKFRDQQRQNAQPRAEIGANGANGFSQPANISGGNQRPAGNHNSLFNEQEVAQLAAQVRAAIGG